MYCAPLQKLSSSNRLRRPDLMSFTSREHSEIWRLDLLVRIGLVIIMQHIRSILYNNVDWKIFVLLKIFQWSTMPKIKQLENFQHQKNFYHTHVNFQWCVLATVCQNLTVTNYSNYWMHVIIMYIYTCTYMYMIVQCNRCVLLHSSESYFIKYNSQNDTALLNSAGKIHVHVCISK